MKTLLLAAGGSRAFAEAGYHYPKNLVEVGGTPLLQHVIEALGPLARDERLVAVVPEDEVKRHHVHRVLSLLEPSVTVLAVGETSGAACSALLACELVPAEEPLLVVNGDQVLLEDLDEIVRDFEARDLDAGVVVFRAVHPRWSYVRTQHGLVVEASEKRPISDLATAGVFWFRRARDFFDGAMEMLRKDAHVDGRFFVCPVLNELVLRGAVIGVREVPRASYYSLHEPAGVQAFEDRQPSPRRAEIPCPR